MLENNSHKISEREKSIENFRKFFSDLESVSMFHLQFTLESNREERKHLHTEKKRKSFFSKKETVVVDKFPFELWKTFRKGFGGTSYTHEFERSVVWYSYSKLRKVREKLLALDESNNAFIDSEEIWRNVTEESYKIRDLMLLSVKNSSGSRHITLDDFVLNKNLLLESLVDIQMVLNNLSEIVKTSNSIIKNSGKSSLNNIVNELSEKSTALKYASKKLSADS